MNFHDLIDYPIENPLNFNWDTAQIDMAFEDTNGNLLFFAHHVSVLLARFKTETGILETTYKLALIRSPEWDYQRGIAGMTGMEGYTFG